GIEFVELSEEDKQAWLELATSAVNELAGKGIYPVEEFKKLQQRLQTLRQEP
ncbi:MAG: C4-dicarboxylate ABC transporter, partial [Thalassolituus sp.]